MNDLPKLIPLRLPTGSSRRERQAFNRFCALMSVADLDPASPIDRALWFERAELGALYSQPTLAAAVHTLVDLLDQGWSISIYRHGPLLAPPPSNADPMLEKARIRRQEHLRRDEQLAQPSVRRFVARMEQPRAFKGQLVSVFDLMRDGRGLAAALEDEDRAAIKPYVQVVQGDTCEFTGLLLSDIWRYFRHTWSNAYLTVPGRSMAVLVRDAATSHHAVIGIAAISSPVVRIAGRDRWIGWDTDTFEESVGPNPTDRMAIWLRDRIANQIKEIYLDDLLEDGVLQPSDIQHPSKDVVALLRADAERHRQKHHRSAKVTPVRRMEHAPWVERALTPLFRSKRSGALADTLEARIVLDTFLASTPSGADLRAALDSPEARIQVRRLIHRARGERVGTVIADLTVCGAVQPYSALAAGKLVAALAVSPKVVTAYQEKYTRPSEIASAMAGRPITRESRLSFISTTSLYGSGSSQYNRLHWPADTMGGDANRELRFRELGRSRSFGTSQFTDETLEALVRLSRVKGDLVRVNGIFGEGVSPRLRKIRIGLAALGWPTNELLKHGRERILYGVELVENLRDYSLGIDPDPDYLIDPASATSDQSVSSWWMNRWALQRAKQEAVLDAMRTHTMERPVRHGARVRGPQDEGDDSDSESPTVWGRRPAAQEG